jgi:hypothetical protein
MLFSSRFWIYLFCIQIILIFYMRDINRKFFRYLLLSSIRFWVRWVDNFFICMRNIINIWVVNVNWIILLDYIYVDYYPCYDKSWSIVESEFLIWTNIYFELISELIAPHLIDVMSWALRYECLFNYDYEPMIYQLEYSC